MEAYLRKHIPLSASMGIRVAEAGLGSVSIEAPLGPNLNHQSTAFGGSVAALATLAGWALVHFRLRAEGFVAHTVIQNSSVHYDAPIRGTFRAVSEPVAEPSWERFTRTLAKRGKGRVWVVVSVQAGGRVAATFKGAYVAIADGPRTDDG